MNNWEEELKKILSGLDKIPDDGTLEEMDDEMQKVYAVCSKLEKPFIEEKSSTTSVAKWHVIAWILTSIKSLFTI